MIPEMLHNEGVDERLHGFDIQASSDPDSSAAGSPKTPFSVRNSFFILPIRVALLLVQRLQRCQLTGPGLFVCIRTSDASASNSTIAVNAMSYLTAVLQHWRISYSCNYEEQYNAHTYCVHVLYD